MDEKRLDLEAHLTDAQLFALAAPAAGEPEALPRHLSRCRACSRALQDWKSAVRGYGREETGELDRRTPGQWRAAEETTMAAIRRAGRPGHRRHPVRWIAGIAASVVLAVLLAAGRRTGPTVVAAPTPTPRELSAADRADDELLRQVSYLAGGGDEESDVPLEDRL